MEPELVSVKTLSVMLDTPVKTIRDWIYRGRKWPTLDPLPYHKIEGLVRFRITEVRAWVDRREIRPSPLLK